MKLGQGSLKRPPWWCWIVMLLMAALTLPGAAMVAAAKDKSKTPASRQTDLQAGGTSTENKSKKLAGLVASFNALIEEKKYAEAEAVAKRALKLNLNTPVVQLMLKQARFARRIGEQSAIEREIDQNLERKISLDFDMTPIHKAVQHIASQCGLNIVLSTKRPQRRRNRL